MAKSGFYIKNQTATGIDPLHIRTGTGGGTWITFGSWPGFNDKSDSASTNYNKQCIYCAAPDQEITVSCKNVWGILDLGPLLAVMSGGLLSLAIIGAEEGDNWLPLKTLIQNVKDGKYDPEIPSSEDPGAIINIAAANASKVSVQEYDTEKLEGSYTEITNFKIAGNLPTTGYKIIDQSSINTLYGEALNIIYEFRKAWLCSGFTKTVAIGPVTIGEKTTTYKYITCTYNMYVYDSNNNLVTSTKKELSSGTWANYLAAGKAAGFGSYIENGITLDWAVNDSAWGRWVPRTFAYFDPLTYNVKPISAAKVFSEAEFALDGDESYYSWMPFEDVVKFFGFASYLTALDSNKRPYRFKLTNESGSRHA